MGSIWGPLILGNYHLGFKVRASVCAYCYQDDWDMMDGGEKVESCWLVFFSALSGVAVACTFNAPGSAMANKVA